MASHSPKSNNPEQLQQVRSSCDTRLAFTLVEVIGMPASIGVMLCQDSTPAIRRAKAQIVARAYHNRRTASSMRHSQHSNHPI